MHNKEIKLRINELLKERLIEYCKVNNTTYAELIRQLITEKLDVDVSLEKCYKLTVKQNYF